MQDRLTMTHAQIIVSACMMWGVVQTAHSQQLSPEATLPSYYFVSPSDAQPARELPSESELPSMKECASGSAVEKLGPAENAGPVNNSGQLVQQRLPSESQLPTPEGDSSPQTPATAADGLQKILADSRDRLPWLRLVEAEHTAPIRVVRFDQSGQNLFTAGEDKIVHHWELVPDQAQAQWRHKTTYRWQVQRAELGTILTLLSSGDELLIAGAGADGQQGEIVSINTVTGNWSVPLVDAGNGHHSPVLGLAMLAQKPVKQIVSSDQKRGIAIWDQDPNLGAWTHRWFRQPEADSKFLYAAFDVLSPATLVVPSVSNPWSIEFYDLASARVVKRLRRDAPLQSQQALAEAIRRAADFYRSTGKQITTEQLSAAMRSSVGEAVVCISVASDGKYVAAADDLGFLYVWNAQEKLELKSLASFAGVRFESIAFSRDGRYLAASAINAGLNKSIVQLWKLTDGQTPILEREFQRESRVYGLDLSPDGRLLAMGVGRALEVVPTARQQAPTVLPFRETIAVPSQVVFANELPYRWKIQLSNGPAAFDGQQMSWTETSGAQWHTATDAGQRFAEGEWTLATQFNAPGAQPEDWIMRGNQRVARLDLAAHYKRKSTSRIQRVAWLKDDALRPVGVAIALSEQNDIWYFALPPEGQNVCALKRIYRGHEGFVSSLDVSPDGRYLISSSQDCTVRIWPTLGLLAPNQEAAPRATWGFDFAVIENRVIAQNPIFSGPLFIKGLRAGDRLKEISYEDHDVGGKLQRTTLAQPEEIVAFLAKPRFDVAVRFIVERAGAEVPGFQSYTHWRELAAQVIAANREWALWTPSGFYDSSFNGNSLFGWQINRGIEKEPAFYRADRFQEVLERPDLIRRLLTSGSVEQAAELAGKRQIGFGDVLENSIALQPQVKILSPTPGQQLDHRETEIRAEITLQRGQQLVSAKAFVSGVVATEMRELSREVLDDARQRIEVSWNAKLPSDKYLQFQVFCSTKERIIGAATSRIARSEALQLSRKPKMFVLAAGVSKYRDSGHIPNLDLAANNARQLVDTLQAQANSLYEIQPLVLTNSSVTRTVWQSTARQLREQLRDVQPDDLIVLFFSGHGMLDDTTGKYYFVTENARYRDLASKDFSDCLSFEDLTTWADVACRKIAILDTCHSGAIQPLDSQSLKHAVRFLQGDLVLTLTASEGNQLAAEYRGAQASLFTGAIQQTLQQRQGDNNADGRLDWQEFVAQVRNLVTQRSIASSVPQFPTAGPRDLLEVVDLPVAGSSAANAISVSHTGSRRRVRE